MEATKATYIAKQTALEKILWRNFEAIEDNKKIVEAVGNITNPMMAAVFVMYGNTVRVQTHKDILQLGYIVVLNASGVLKNSTLVGGWG